MKQKFDIIIPIGFRCFNSLRLRRNNLQFASFPFDWLMNCNLETSVKTLEEKFEKFLLKENLQLVTEEPHPEFKDIQNGLSFMHDFDSGNLELSYPKVKTRYCRRIKRLYDDINNAENILFCYIGYEDINNQELILYHQRLQSLFPEKNINLLYVFENNNVTDYAILRLSPQILKTTIHNPDGYEKGDEKYKDLFSTIGLTFATRLKYFLPNLKYKVERFFKSRTMINILCWFVPSKNGRQKLRLIFRRSAIFRQ